MLRIRLAGSIYTQSQRVFHAIRKTTLDPQIVDEAGPE